MHEFFLRLVVPLVSLTFLTACANTAERKFILPEYSIVNGGGDIESVNLVNNSVQNLLPGNSIVFFKGEDPSVTYKSKTSKARINVGNPIDTVDGFQVPKINVNKSVSTLDMPGVEAWGSTLPIDRTVSQSSQDVYYYYHISSIGNADIAEIVLADVLPKEIAVQSVEYWWTNFLATAVIKSGDFDELTWESNQKDGKDYLLVRVKMEDKPLSTKISGMLTARNTMILRVKGKLDLTVK